MNPNKFPHTKNQNFPHDINDTQPVSDPTLSRADKKKFTRIQQQEILVRPRRSRLQKDTVYVQALENNELT